MHILQTECVQTPFEPCYGLKGAFESIWKIMNRSAGYTLIEVLIMLAVTAILAATVLETVRASASNGLRIEQAARNASQDYITLAGVRRAVENTRADYSNEPGVFIGDDTQFSALTSQALMADRPGVQRYALRLENSPQGATLVYEDAAGSFQARFWANAEGRFTYYGDQPQERAGFSQQIGRPRPREWTAQWPPDQSLSVTNMYAYYEPVPLAVRADIRLDTGETWMTVFQLSSTSGPTPRVEDLLGDFSQ